MSTALFTAFQEKSSELGWEEIQDPWLQDRHANCICVCTEGHVDRAVKHDGSEEANPSCIFGRASKAAPSGEAEGLRHGPAISTPHAELTGVQFPKALGAGCCTESGDKWFLLNTGTAVNYQLIRCSPRDSCTTAGRNFAFKFYKQKMGGGHTFNKSSNDS